MLERRKATEEGKDPFLSLVAHEFRNGIGPPIGYMRMVLKGTFGPVDEKLKDILSKVQSSLDKLYDLTQQLSQFSLLEGGGGTFTKEPLDVAVFLQEAIASVPPADDAEQHVRITLRKPIPTSAMQGNREQLRSALGTLLYVLRRELAFDSELVVSVRHGSIQTGPAVQVAIAEAGLLDALEAAGDDGLVELDPYIYSGVGFRLLSASHILIERHGVSMFTLHPVNPQDPLSKPPPGILLLLPAS